MGADLDRGNPRLGVYAGSERSITGDRSLPVHEPNRPFPVLITISLVLLLANRFGAMERTT